MRESDSILTATISRECRRLRFCLSLHCTRAPLTFANAGVRMVDAQQWANQCYKRSPRWPNLACLLGCPRPQSFVFHCNVFLYIYYKYYHYLSHRYWCLLLPKMFTANVIVLQSFHQQHNSVAEQLRFFHIDSLAQDESFVYFRKHSRKCQQLKPPRCIVIYIKKVDKLSNSCVQ